MEHPDVSGRGWGLKTILYEKENCNPNKIHLIRHGFKLNLFENKPEIDKLNNIRTKYKIYEKNFNIGVISRFIKLKGVQNIIKAFINYSKLNPNAHLILANATGDYKKEIEKLLLELNPIKYTLIEFESEINLLYHCFDCFVHVPIDQFCEAFGQTYIESLACGIPSIFTKSGIANDFIIDQENALVVPFQNPSNIEKAIYKIESDQNLRKILIENGRKSIQQFELKRMIDGLEKLYLKKN